MDIIFWILLGFILLQGTVGVAEGILYLGYVRQHLRKPLPDWTPKVTVFLPCKGIEPGLLPNVAAVLGQDYPDYEVIIVTATSRDPALAALQGLATGHSGKKFRLVTAGVSEERGEKVNNLISAVAQASATTEVYVFTDSDCRPHRLWLRELVAPLSDRAVGISTGYRWYFPVPGNFATALRSAWNASIATLLGNHNRNFCWGGSMAIRRTVFEDTRVLDYWRYSISDDYSMAAAVRAAGMPIHYEPRCLIASDGEIRLQELLDWAARQILITRVYSPRLWKLALLSQFPFVIGWWWAVCRCVTEVANVLMGGGLTHPARVDFSLVSFIYLLGVIRGWYRWQSIRLIRSDSLTAIDRFAWCYMLLAPLVSTLTAYTLVASLLNTQVKWRGVKYELISSREMRVIRGS